MPEKAPWIKRRFTFDTPLSMFPNILERLRGTPARIEDLVRDISQGKAMKRIDGRWSIQENIGHLIEVEDLWLGRLDDFADGIAVLRPADMKNRRTDAAEYNKQELREILKAFRRIRTHFIQRLESMDEEAIGRMSHHPRLNQPMKIPDMMFFASEHDDHHIVRIAELLRELELNHREDEV
ncbi:MAG: DinB family protein [Candidatus Eisenbacteria bacterium]|uniref:DinB family protein n=1 Tax=Eiseniibacteriota bacterium TaxID=2212470 RepID=A0A948W881_UNCEI|nr:DinB family protein [Candidatus Eisenbacteria bacterium]MBU1947447.1 DinB family protein [Candidatus Eisenbacteria bacterium]MBU2692426.1 DinB family protein [Candidatus Eisenbacteria bacterium]